VSADFRDALLDLRSGAAAPAEFVARTQDVFARFARYLMRRWKTPSAVDQEDVEQELRLAAWAALWKWDPERGVPIDRFITFQCLDKAKKWMHRQRNAKRRDDSAAGRYALPFSAFTVHDDQPADSDRWASEQAVAEDDLARRQHEREALDALGDAAIVLDRPYRLCVGALVDAQGDIDEAVAAIVADPALRLALRLEDIGSIDRTVRRSVRLAAKELGFEEGGLR
jgi:DNA-directed RNA polymerase specialized sigma24 family protein